MVEAEAEAGEEAAGVVGDREGLEHQTETAGATAQMAKMDCRARMARAD